MIKEITCIEEQAGKIGYGTGFEKEVKGVEAGCGHLRSHINSLPDPEKAIEAILKKIRLKAENLQVEAKLSRHTNRALHADAAAKDLNAAIEELEKFLRDE